MLLPPRDSLKVGKMQKRLTRVADGSMAYSSVWNVLTFVLLLVSSLWLLKKIVKQVTREVLGVNPCRIVVRKMKTRWASCSFKGTITVNSLAIHLPEHLIAYIVYHEICHLIEPRHNEAFLECIRGRYPNYGELEKELLAYEIKLGLHSESTYKE